MLVPRPVAARVWSGACMLMMLYLASARSFFASDLEDVDKMTKRGEPMCSKNMACRWALCPWSPKASAILPSVSSCLVINNDSCECPANHRCMLTDFIEPETQFVKFEYRCGSPDLTQQVYQLDQRTD